jgi:hypothetical protein
MKDIIDRYEESKYPALLEILFFMILIIDLLLPIWVSFMASLHIEKMPYLKNVYMVVIPIAYILPLVDAILIKKTKKYLVKINNIYLVLRVVYLSFFFINEINYRLAVASHQMDKEIYSGIINSGVFNIVCIFLFSFFWLFTINLSKAIKYHIGN